MSVISLNVTATKQQNTLPAQQFMLNGVLFQLEVAQTRQELQIGLMGRASLAANEGMLFVFPDVRRHGIWMHNVKIPLTVAWLDQQMKVIHVEKLFPCRIKYCPTFRPKKPSAFVVELAIDVQINVGDRLIYRN